MKQTYDNVANFQNTFFNQINSNLKSETELWERKKFPVFWKKSVEKAILFDDSPNCLIFPNSKASLSQLVKLSYENNWCVFPTGNGSKLSWGGVVKNKIDLLISTAKLNQIIDYAEDDLTITVEAGIKLKDLQDFLREKGQFLPIDASYPDSATIGGIIATADTGSWRQRYSGVRDLILGISFVRCDGQIAKAGGRVVKNVAGYDLMKLFTGSYGTLGVICEVTFRLYPLPETSSTLLIDGEAENIAKLRQAIVSSALTPTCADLISPSLMKSMELGDNVGIILRFESILESIENQIKQVESWAETLNLKSSLYRVEEEKLLWEKLNQKFTNQETETSIICKVGILPSQIVKLFQKFNPEGLINISKGLGRLYLNTENSSDLTLKIRNFCNENKGFLTILEASQSIKEAIEPWGYTGNAIHVMKSLKQKFDPKNTFKPNYFVGNL